MVVDALPSGWTAVSVVRGKHHVLKAAQRAVRRKRLIFEDIQGGTAQMPCFQSTNQSGLIDHRTAGRIDQHRARFYARELSIRDQMVAGWVEVAVQADEIRLFNSSPIATI